MSGRALLWVCASVGLATLAPAQGPAPTDTKSLTTSIGMKLKRIPAGTFVMGSSRQENVALLDEEPRHTVTLSRPFYLGVYEVTQREYTRIMNNNPSKFRYSDLLPVNKCRGSTRSSFATS